MIINQMLSLHEMESIKSPTRKIRTQLEILLHSKKCVSQPCDVANCGEFKSVLLHMDHCKEGRACQVSSLVIQRNEYLFKIVINTGYCMERWKTIVQTTIV